MVVGSGSLFHVTTTASQLPTRDNLESLRLPHNTTMNENVLKRYIGVTNRGGGAVVLRVSSDGDNHQMGAKIKAQKSKIPDYPPSAWDIIASEQSERVWHSQLSLYSRLLV